MDKWNEFFSDLMTQGVNKKKINCITIINLQIKKKKKLLNKIDIFIYSKDVPKKTFPNNNLATKTRKTKILKLISMYDKDIFLLRNVFIYFICLGY